MTLPGPSLYVHIPFCHSRCGYCTFTSSHYTKASADAYLDVLEKEWADRRGDWSGPPSTLFIGGGTPTSLSTSQLERLLRMLPPVEGEATCECNPETASPEKLALLHDHGINRISFGVQTWSDTGRQILGRRHTAAQAEQAVAIAKKIGFQNINIDLINSWPGQSQPELEQDIKKSVALEIQHISNYTLILDKEARNYSRLNAELASDYDDEARAFWDVAEAYLKANGFRHYETSNFALSGFECAHNVAIWKYGEYMGLGCGAHSHWHGRRFCNVDDIRAYVAGKGEAFSEYLDEPAHRREAAVFWLRLFDGIDRAEYCQRLGVDVVDVYEGVFPEGVVVESERVYVSPEYQPVLDMILVDMV